MRREQEGPLPAELGELGVEELRPRLVERAVRLVQHEQLRLVKEHAAEREPLRHAAGVRGDPLVPCLPETEALEQHADPLAALGQAVEAPVELEVLERGQLPVDEWLVPEVADLRALAPRSIFPSVGWASPAQIRSSVVFPEPFGPVTTRKPPRGRSRSTSARRASPRSACRAGGP